MSKPIITFVDADSIACSAGCVEDPSQVKFVCDNYIKDIYNATQCSEIRGFVEQWGWKQNYRKHLSVSREYKGGRGEKPQWTDEAKKYMVKTYGFSVVRFVESEDCVSCSMGDYGLNYCFGAAIDKDIKYGCPGRFYDYKKKEWQVNTIEQANKFLFTQILIGDTCDGWLGCAGCGAKTAPLLIDAAPPEEWPIVVARKYKESGHTYEYLLEQSRIAYILRSWHDSPFTPITREAWDEI